MLLNIIALYYGLMLAAVMAFAVFGCLLFFLYLINIAIGVLRGEQG